MILVLCGKQCASSKHSCPFCTGSSPWLGVYTANTIGSLWADYTAFVARGADIKKAMLSNNVTNPPLITGPNEKKILGDLFFFPELHVMTGTVEKLFKELERSEVFETAEEGKKILDDWLETPGVNVTRTVYHGKGGFVGNQAKRLLTKVDNLQKVLHEYFGQDNGERLDLADSFILAFKQFDIVIQSCFGQDLVPGYADRIQEFMVRYRSLGISIPLKVYLYYFTINV